MTTATRRTALVLATALALSSIALLLARSGLLALIGAFFGVAMLIKLSRRPGASDLRWLAVGIAAWAALWGGTLAAVYAGWESAEVVTLRPVDPTTGERSELRLWVVDDEASGGPVVFYDGSPERLAAIGTQPTLEWERGGVTHRSRPILTLQDDASPELVERITRLYDEKYGALDWAAGLFYVLAGRSSGRTLGILQLGPADTVAAE